MSENPGFWDKLYLADFKAYPIVVMSREDLPPPDNRPIYWFQQLEPYSGAIWPTNQLGSLSVSPKSGLYCCPSYARAIRIPGQVTNGATMFGGGYGYNWRGTAHKPGSLLGLGGNILALNYASDPPFSFQYRPTKESEIVKPNVMLAIGDAPIGPFIMSDSVWGTAGYSDLTWGLEWFANWGIPPTGSGVFGPWNSEIWKAIQKRHHGHWNMVHCDGHLQSFMTRSLFDKKDQAVLSRWNKDNMPHGDLLPK